MSEKKYENPEDYIEGRKESDQVWIGYQKSGIPLTLADYGECPSKEYVQHNLNKEDVGEFSVCC